MKTVPLNIMLSYPVTWKRHQILRDIIQNFYDSVGMTQFHKLFRTSYDADKGIATISIKSEGFNYEWLMHMGASTKQDRSGKFAGFFGEGFKVAALCALDTALDGRTLQQLAYHIKEDLPTSAETILTISSFSQEDADLLENAVLGFYYPENPLFGNCVYENEHAAIYERSKMKKPTSMPLGYDLGGEGIVFIGFQARSSFPFPLMLANHAFKTEERERNEIYSGTVMNIILDMIEELDPKACYYLLERFEKYWYEYPDKKKDVKSWYPVVRKLIRKIVYYSSLANEFVKSHPNLAVCEQATSIYTRNRKHQALSWKKLYMPDVRLVQDSFCIMGYDTIVDLCEKAEGFNATRFPSLREMKLIKILDSAAQEIYGDFLKDYPACVIIENESSAFDGTAKMIKRKDKMQNSSGPQFRYDVTQVEIKKVLLEREGFAVAFATYSHELCHCFGGDSSNSFSNALTTAMSLTMANLDILEKYNRLWINVFDNNDLDESGGLRCEKI